MQLGMKMILTLEGEMDSYRWHSVDYKEGRCIVSGMFIHPKDYQTVSPRVTIGWHPRGKTSQVC